MITYINLLNNSSPKKVIQKNVDFTFI